MNGLCKTLCDALDELAMQMREKYHVSAEVDFQTGTLMWKRYETSSSPSSWELVVVGAGSPPRGFKISSDSLSKEVRVAAIDALPGLLDKLDALSDESCRKHIDAVGIVDECHKRVVRRAS